MERLQQFAVEKKQLICVIVDTYLGKFESNEKRKPREEIELVNQKKLMLFPNEL